MSLLLVSSFSVYALLAAGLGSNSKYSVLGGLRCIAQCISYEVVLSLLLLSFCTLSGFNILKPYLSYGFFCLTPLCLALFVTLLAETNRSPFDFAEGESELVSGFNVEFSGPGFVLLFLSEYLSLLFMSMIISLISFSGSFLLSTFLGLIFAFAWI